MQAILSVCVALSAAYPSPQSNEFAQERDGGHHAPSYGKQPDGYFQYVNVPAHKEYEFGWNRGNPHHYISRYEQGKDHRFRTRVSELAALSFAQCSLLRQSNGMPRTFPVQSMSPSCFKAMRPSPQVRWGDKHGGYGEQYWEYNHAPKHGHDDHKVEYHPPPKYHAAAA